MKRKYDWGDNMKYSDKLNGYWEEGYHYYLEFRDDKLTVRGYDRGIRLETTVSYDAEKLDSGERTVISLADNILSRTYEGKMMTEIKELAYENGELKFLYYYTIMGETLYTLTKKENGPFDHIIIRDEEFIDKLQGRWEQWTASGEGGTPMIINGNTVSWVGGGGQFHVVSYRYAPDKVYITPADLTKSDFNAFTKIQVLPDMLTTTMMVCDMSMPLSVFARKDMIDKIDIPGGAKIRPRNTMICEPMMPSTAAPIGMNGFMGIMEMQEVIESCKNTKYCSGCGKRLPDEAVKFCPECGNKLN